MDIGDTIGFAVCDGVLDVDAEGDIHGTVGWVLAGSVGIKVVCTATDDHPAMDCTVVLPDAAAEAGRVS